MKIQTDKYFLLEIFLSVSAVSVQDVQVILQTAVIDDLAMLTRYNITAGMTSAAFHLINKKNKYGNYKSIEALNKIACLLLGHEHDGALIVETR